MWSILFSQTALFSSSYLVSATSYPHGHHQIEKFEISNTVRTLLVAVKLCPNLDYH